MYPQMDIKIKETDLHIIDFDKGTVWSKLLKKNIGYINQGYYFFHLNGHHKALHRYIYELYHNVKLTPEQHINHIDHNPLNNRIDNLNLVDNQRNSQYSKKSSHNTSGVKSVSWCKIRNKWRIRIMVNKKDFHINYCKTKEEGIELYNQVCRYLNELGFYYYIEGEDIILNEDNRHLFNEEDFEEYIRKLCKRKKIGNGGVYQNKNGTFSSRIGRSFFIGTYKTQEQAQEKLNIVVEYRNNNPDISVEDLKKFIESIK